MTIITSAGKAPRIMGVKATSKIKTFISFGAAPEDAVGFDPLVARSLPPAPPVNVAPEALSTFGCISATTGPPRERCNRAGPSSSTAR